MHKFPPPIIVHQSFPVSPETLWQAITQHNQMIQWFFENIPAFEARVGFETKFAVRSGERTFTHLWEITEVIPLRKIVYRWRYLEYPGEGFVHFELSVEEGKTSLTLTNLGLESFPQDIPEFRRESCQGGWQYFIQQRLTQFIQSQTTP